MRMKPKSTVHNPRALLYKRFTDVETSFSSGRIVLYHTEDNKYWQFSAEKVGFYIFDGDISTFPAERIVEAGGSTFRVYLQYTNYYYYYSASDGKWLITKTAANGGTTAYFPFEDVQESLLSDWESIADNNIPVDPFPQSIEVVTNSGLDRVSILIIPDTVQTSGLAVYQRAFEDGEKVAGTFDVPLLHIVDLSAFPPQQQQEILAHTGEISFVIERDKTQEPPDEGWNVSISIGSIPAQTLAAKFADIGRYQTNKYYYAGSFDYMIRGSVGSQDTQYIKGNIMHLRSFEIKHFDDSINIDHDDLVVIEGRLYSVSDLTRDPKRSPKPYNVYFATLNNIL